MQKKEKLELRVKPKQPVQVNKPVVLVVVAVVVFVILLAIINAFNATKIVKITEPSSAIKVTVDKPMGVSSELQDLPGSYSDVHAIQKYLPTSLQSGEVEKLQLQLNEMRDAYKFLEQQLRNVNQSSVTHEIRNPKTEQAKSSGLVFAGLGTGVDNLIGGAAAAAGSFGRGVPMGQRLGSQQAIDENVVATSEQAKFFEKQAENVQKVAVLKAADKPGEIYSLHNMAKPVSNYQIQAGTIISAALITGIDSALAGTIVAQVRQDLYDTVTGKHLLIPKGSKLLGEYDSRITQGQRRVMMYFTRIIRPNGSSLLLDRLTGADLLGHSGVEGSVDNHWARVLGASTISTLLSVGAGAASSDDDRNKNYRSSAQNAILGASQGISNVGQMLTGRAMSIQPTITLPSGYQFVVVVKKDMVLTPYKSRR